jgi:hypothetical protein
VVTEELARMEAAADASSDKGDEELPAA